VFTVSGLHTLKLFIDLEGGRSGASKGGCTVEVLLPSRVFKGVNYETSPQFSRRALVSILRNSELLLKPESGQYMASKGGCTSVLRNCSSCVGGMGVTSYENEFMNLHF
jgi:hypothetical protein